VKSYYDLFRQSREIIKERVYPFVRYFNGLEPIADIGCGRGEFLELLKNNNIECIGVDSDIDMIDLCLKAGLRAKHEELFNFMNSAIGYGGLFISHVIEHLNGDDAEKMIALGFVSLRPGGRMVIITPNPENISVMTKAFWLDPTHIRPYPLALLCEMLKEAGFNIISSGGAPGTFSSIRFYRMRRFLAGLILPPVGIRPMWDYLHTAQDIYIVGEKPNSGVQSGATGNEI